MLNIEPYELFKADAHLSDTTNRPAVIRSLKGTIAVMRIRCRYGKIEMFSMVYAIRMGLFEIVVIAIGLSMDAFAISITLGLLVTKSKPIEYFIPGIYFGFFQAIMPYIGFRTGTLFAARLQTFEHWIAFVLLTVIGGKMIHDSFSKDTKKADENPFGWIKMLILALVTSIDALAVGVTFAFFPINIYLAIVIIGIMTFCISVAGVKIGNIFGAKYKSKAEFVGGAVLVLLGIKIVIEHL